MILFNRCFVILRQLQSRKDRQLTAASDQRVHILYRQRGNEFSQALLPPARKPEHGLVDSARFIFVSKAEKQRTAELRVSTELPTPGKQRAGNSSSLQQGIAHLQHTEVWCVTWTFRELKGAEASLVLTTESCKQKNVKK